MSDDNKPRKRGAPKGNQNAKGRRSGAPIANKRAVVTGEHERLLFDTLTDEEKLFMNSVILDKTIILREELILLTVRERRMMKRIADLMFSQKGMSIQRISSREISHHRKNGLASTTETTKEIEPVMNIVQRIEESLTRIQTRKQLIVDQIHRIDYDNKRLAIEEQKYKADLSGISSAFAQIQTIADLINSPSPGRKLDDFLSGGAADDTLRTADDESD